MSANCNQEITIKSSYKLRRISYLRSLPLQVTLKTFFIRMLFFRPNTKFPTWVWPTRKSHRPIQVIDIDVTIHDLKHANMFHWRQHYHKNTLHCNCHFWLMSWWCSLYDWWSVIFCEILTAKLWTISNWLSDDKKSLLPYQISDCHILIHLFRQYAQGFI